MAVGLRLFAVTPHKYRSDSTFAVWLLACEQPAWATLHPGTGRHFPQCLMCSSWSGPSGWHDWWHWHGTL